MPDLEPGDFLYQSDQELFLVVVEENKNSYLFAAHGWRDIDKERIDQYLEDTKSKVHQQEQIEQLVEEKGNAQTIERFEKLKELFQKYEDITVVEDGPQSDFALEDRY